MLTQITAKMSPKTKTMLKVTAVVVGAAAAAVVVGVVLYKTGMIGNIETVEEVIEAATQVA